MEYFYMRKDEMLQFVVTWTELIFDDYVTQK